MTSGIARRISKPSSAHSGVRSGSYCLSLRRREHDKNDEPGANVQKAVRDSRADEGDGPRTDPAPLTGDLERRVAVAHDVELVLRVRFLRVLCSRRENVDPGRERRGAEKFQVWPLLRGLLTSKRVDPSDPPGGRGTRAGQCRTRKSCANFI